MRAIFRKMIARFYEQNPRNITYQNLQHYIPKDIVRVLDSTKISLIDTISTGGGGFE